MFRSKRRQIVFPQTEHVRLAVAVAELLSAGGYSFGGVAYSEIVVATSEHDRGYPVLDNFPVEETARKDWVEIHRQGLSKMNSSYQVNILVALHIQRLMSFYDEPICKALSDECDSYIENQLKGNSVPRSDLERASNLVAFCDMVAFDFCFEHRRSNSFVIFPDSVGQESVTLHYEVKEEGLVAISPWPAKVKEVYGTITAYDGAKYPEELIPFLVPFFLREKM